MDSNNGIGTVTVKVIADTDEFEESIDRIIAKLDHAISLMKDANQMAGGEVTVCASDLTEAVTAGRKAIRDSGEAASS